MFRSKDVFHVKAYIPRDKTEELILALHERGICELKAAEAELEKHPAHREPREVEELQARLAMLIEELNAYKEIVQPENMIKGLLFPKPPEKTKVDLLSNKEIFADVDSFLKTAEPKVLPHLERTRAIGEETAKNIEIIDALGKMPHIATSVFRSTENISVALGTVLTKSIEKIKASLPEGAVLGIEEIDAKSSLIAAFSLAEKGQETERALHEQGFEPLEIPFENKEPKKIILELETKNKKMAKEKRVLEEKLRTAWKELHARLDVLEDEVSVVQERNHALELMRAGMGFAIMEAWVPGTDFEKFRTLVERIAKNYYLESAEREDAPTIYDNPRIIKPFEMLTSLYDVPKYKTIDPTPVLAVSFTLFFGFMLTDFFYGVLLVIFGYLIFRGIGKYNAGMRQFTAVLIMAGISTAILGAVFGSYMGDIFTKFGIQMPMVIDPMKQVVIVIAASLIIGALHLGTALVMGYYENVKKGRIKDAFAKQGVWLAFLIGIVFAIVDGGLFQMIGMGLIGIAVLMNLYFSFKESGPIVSALSVFNFSGFVGDVFSYARLTALAVGTAGIALAVNFMALMVAGMIPIIGIPIAIVLFIVGHLFNMVMNGLGAFVHSLRLHFLEFFSKFYDGGGRLYKPFYAMRTKNYTEVDEWQ